MKNEGEAEYMIPYPMTNPIETAREVLRGDVPPDHSSLLLFDFERDCDREPLFYEPEQVNRPPSNLPEAISECLQALANEARRPYQNRRLTGRVCAAIRAELAALVEDWDALNGGAE